MYCLDKIKAKIYLLAVGLVVVVAGAVAGQAGAASDSGFAPPLTRANERKHLHLAIHLGKQINWRGYVRKQAELKYWLNPSTLK